MTEVLGEGRALEEEIGGGGGGGTLRLARDMDQEGQLAWPPAFLLSKKEAKPLVPAKAGSGLLPTLHPPVFIRKHYSQAENVNTH